MKHPVDELLQQLYGMSDNQLLQEFNAAKREIEADGGIHPDPAGFERLWEKLKREQETGGHQ